MKNGVLAVALMIGSFAFAQNSFAKRDIPEACKAAVNIYAAAGIRCNNIGYTDYCGSNTVECKSNSGYFYIYPLAGECYGYGSWDRSLPIQLPHR